MKKKEIVFFDFDGTITTKDSTKEFYKFVYGGFFWFRYYFTNLLFYFLVKVKTKNYLQLKIKRLKDLINYVGSENLKSKGLEFQRKILPGLIKKDALKKIEEYKLKGMNLVIVSASMDILINEWSKENGFVTITNELELKSNKYTGKFVREKDCNFEEKVIRIREKFPNLDANYTYAYGDMAMLEIADESYYNVLKK